MKVFYNNGSRISISGNGTVYINGRRYVPSEDDEEKSNVDLFQEQSFKASEIRNVHVDVPCGSIRFVNSSFDSNIVVRTEGKAYGSKDIQFKIIKEDDTIRVSLESKSNNNINYSNLSVNLFIPCILLRHLVVNTTSGDISFDDEIKSESFSINAVSASIRGSIIANEIKTNSVSGDVNLNVKAINHVYIRCNSVSGDVDLKLEKVSLQDNNFSTISGDKTILYNGNGNSSAHINVSTTSGDLTIR